MTKMIEIANILESKYLAKTAYIKKLPSGKYRVYAENGKHLGTYDSRSAAEKRLRQVEYFKHKKKSDIINEAYDFISQASKEEEEETYSSMLRKLNKKGDKKAIHCFLSVFKLAFDQFVLCGDKEPAEKALPIALFVLCREFGEI